MLPIAGADLPGVIAYRDIADTMAMIDAASRSKRAVVIGGGLLGLEAANGLRLRGMQVTVVHVMPWLMERQLDAVAGAMLQKSLESRGIVFALNAKTTALHADASGRVSAVVLAGGSSVAADLVVMAVGIRPNINAADAGLHVQRGIVVDDTMQTVTDPRIYAVGECVSHRGTAYGLVTPLFEMAKVCATHLAQNGLGRFRSVVPSTKLKVTGVDVFSIGDRAASMPIRSRCRTDAQRVQKSSSTAIAWSACLIGDTEHAAWYTKLVKDRTPIGDTRDTLMFGQSNLGDAGHQAQQGDAACRRRGSMRLQRRMQGHDRRSDPQPETDDAGWCAGTPRHRARAVRAPLASRSCLPPLRRRLFADSEDEAVRAPIARMPKSGRRSAS